MNKYTKLIAGALSAVAILIATSAFAQNTVKAGTVAQSTPTTDNSLFNAGEYGLALSSGYNLDKAELFKTPYSLNASAGAFWFPLRNLGFEANVPFYQSKGVSVDQVQAGALLRLPLSRNVFLLRNIAPYAGLGGTYNWQAKTDLSYDAKLGVEVRVNKGWGVFGEYEYQNDKIGNLTTSGQSSVRGGLRFVF